MRFAPHTALPRVKGRHAPAPRQRCIFPQNKQPQQKGEKDRRSGSAEAAHAPLPPSSVALSDTSALVCGSGTSMSVCAAKPRRRITSNREWAQAVKGGGGGAAVQSKLHSRSPPPVPARMCATTVRSQKTRTSNDTKETPKETNEPPPPPRSPPPHVY